MKDKDFLQWLHGRLNYVHKENTNVDYMLKLQAIINNLDENKTTPNSVPSTINMIDHISNKSSDNIFGYMSESKNVAIEPSSHIRKFNLRDMPEKKKTFNKSGIFKNSI